MNIRGRKGREIDYNSLQISEYLSPNMFINNIELQQILFNIRNKMLKVKSKLIENQDVNCLCSNLLSTSHLYYCTQLDTSTPRYELNTVYNGNLQQQLYITKRIKTNMKYFQENPDD